MLWMTTGCHSQRGTAPSDWPSDRTEARRRAAIARFETPGWHTPLVPQSKWIAIADSPDRLLLTTHDQGLAGFTTLARVSDDGKELWRGRVGGGFSASPIVVGGSVINVSADGEVVVIADGDAFEVLGRTPLGEPCRATPAVVGGRMYFRSVGRLHALDATDAAASSSPNRKGRSETPKFNRSTAKSAR